MGDKNVSLVGNPNCGKTTLFNKLTGKNFAVGNWAGVTVAKNSAKYKSLGHGVNLIDLPGCYTLVSSHDSSIDEKVTCEHILEAEDTLFLNVVDATNLNRGLFLTLQLKEQGLPTILVLNQLDLARKQGLKLDLNILSKELDCPVVAISAKTGEGLLELKSEVNKFNLQEFYASKSGLNKFVKDEIRPFIANWQAKFAKLSKCPSQVPGLIKRAIEGDYIILSALENTGSDFRILLEAKNSMREQSLDVAIAMQRHELITQVLKKATIEKAILNKNKISKALDRVFLDKFLGIPIFFGIIYLMFVFTINIAGSFQDFFDIATEAIFVDSINNLLTTLNTPEWLKVIFKGVGKGINITLTFIPVIGGLYLFLSFLENSGYMTRGAFVMDRMMQFFGLPGKSFVPLIMGFGCNVPAVMGARTLDSKKERILTVMVSPFMSCSARLAIYAVFVSTFFPKTGQNVIFALYIIGILVAILTVLLLRRTLLNVDKSPLVMELPEYKLPSIKSMLKQTWYKIKSFVNKAGALIIPFCIVVSVMGEYRPENSSETIFETIGKKITPVMQPMGVDEDNWPAVVGLLTGMLAKEVVIGTLNMLYAEEIEHEVVGTGYSLTNSLKRGVDSIKDNFAMLPESFMNPMVRVTSSNSTEQNVHGVMYEKFKGPVAAFAYLLFVLLYFPCVSVVASIARELDKKWAAFSVVWTTGIAYVVAVSFYQLATFAQHPVSSIRWVLSLLLGFTVVVIGMKYYLLRSNLVTLKRTIPTRIATATVKQ